MSCGVFGFTRWLPAKADREMDFTDKVSAHYHHGDLLETIRAGLAQLGIAPHDASIEDLGPVDEFHIGGRAASAHFLGQLGISATEKLLDVGCGLGGSARFVAKTYGAAVVGVDLTPEYVETGRTLCEWVGVADRVDLLQGSALAMPLEDEVFDAAYMMHVGMNIEDKPGLCAEVARVLKPGGRFAIYDVMKANSEDLVFPVPWASSVETSWVAAPDTYRRALEDAGFRVVAETDRRDFAIEFFKKVSAATAAAGGPPPLGLHVLMQQSTAEKIPNMIANLVAGRIAPVEMIAERGG